MDEQLKYTVYMHVNKINNKKYIGITSQEVNKRWKNGLGYQDQMFYRAILKYGWDGFDHIIVYEGIPQQEAFQKEQELIKLYNTTEYEYGYNKSDGGESGSLHSYNTQKKKMKRVYRYDRYGNYIDTFISIGEAARQVDCSTQQISNCCNHRTQLAKGCQWFFEFLGKKIDAVEEGGRRTNKNRMRKVAQYSKDGELLKTYECIIDAQKETGINRCAIGNCCMEKTKTSGGYMWKYIDN